MVPNKNWNNLTWILEWQWWQAQGIWLRNMALDWYFGNQILFRGVMTHEWLELKYHSPQYTRHQSIGACSLALSIKFLTLEAFFFSWISWRKEFFLKFSFCHISTTSSKYYKEKFHVIFCNNSFSKEFS